MKKILTLGCMILLSGCNDNIPKCNGTNTIETAVNIIKREYAQLNYSKVEINNIRTTGKDKDIGMSQCAADVDLGYTSGASFTKSITYTTQLTDDGKNIYVNIWGLWG
ncbi:hypothetical protein B6O77_000873 [Salmonella enterica subsp. enterica serovar Mississippi]|nr:hypothetical protein [Salmonella enterica subsp. enterica serovar Mississippi]